MAKSDATVVVDVRDNGSAGKVAKNLRGVTDSAKAAGASYREANKHQSNFFDKQNKGTIGVANSTKSFSKLAQTLGGDGGGIVGTYAALAANIFAVSAAFNALRNAAQVEQVLRGLELAGARVGRTYTTVARDLRDLTNGALSSEQSLRAVAQVSAAGFGADAMRDLTQAAFDTSVALGRNLTDSMDRIIRGVVKLEPELLDELGIMTKLTESNAAYAASLGKNVSQLTAFEKRQGYLNAVINEAELKFGGLSAAAGDAAAFDQLAATFTDLTKTVMNFINNAALPLAQLFSASPLGLAGLLLIFAGTLRGQLLPGLTDLAKRSVQAAEAKRKLASDSSKLAKQTLASAEATKQADIATQRNTLQTNIGSKAYREYINGVRGGNSVLAGREKALASLKKSEVAYRTQESNNINVKNAQANLALIAQQRTAIQHLSDTETKAAQLRAGQENIVGQARIRTIVSIKESVAQEAAGKAVILAGEGRRLDALNQYAAAIKKYDQAQRVSTNGAVSGLGLVKTASFAAATGVRILGAAFLNFLPVIGQIIFVVGILAAAWEAMKSRQEKVAARAREDFDTVVTQTARAVDELNRIETASGPLALKTAQRITIQANAVQEVVAAYREVLRTQEAVARNEAERGDSSSGTAAWYSSALSAGTQALVGPSELLLNNGSDQTTRDIASYWTGIKRESDQFTPDIIEAYSFKNLFLTDNDSIIENRLAPAINSLDALEPTLSAATKAAISFNEEKERINQIGDFAERAKQINQLINKVAEATANGGASISALVDSLKEADLAFGDFIRGSIQSTSYDKTVDGLTAVTNAISNIEDSTARGVVGLDDWKNVLTGIGPEMTKFLSPVSAEIIRITNEANATKDSLNGIKEAGLDLTIGQTQALSRAEATLRANEQRLPIVVEEVRQLENQFKLMQNMERVTKSQIALEQARITAASDLYDASAAGVAARIDAENSIKALQASMLEAQKAIIDASILQNQIEIQRLRTLEHITGELEQQTIVATQQTLTAATQYKLTAETQANAVGVNADNYQSILRFGRAGADSAQFIAASAIQISTMYAEQASTRLTNLRAIESGESAVAGLQAAALSLANQIEAILVSQVTETEKRAAVARKIFEIETENLSIINEQRDALQNTNEILAAQDAALRSSTDSLSNRLRVINGQLARTTEQNNIAAANRINALRAQIITLQGLRSRDSELADHGIAVLNTQIGLIQRATDATNAEALAAADLQRIELLIFDTRKEGLEWQREGLNLIQQQVDAQRDLSELVLRRTQAESALHLRRMGLEQSEEGTRADEIRNATQAYVLAVQEASLKKSLIELEFDLLEAQRELLREQLIERRNALQDPQNNIEGRNNGRIASLGASISGLSNSSALREAEAARIRAVDENIRILAVQAQTAMQPTVTGMNSVLSRLIGLQDITRATREAETALLEARSVDVGRVVNPVITEIAPNPQIAANIIALNANTAAQQAAVERQTAAGITGAQSGVTSSTSRENAVAIAEAAGARVTELLGVGAGVTPRRLRADGSLLRGHRGSQHYEGRAFDVNMGPRDDSERTDPVINARMDRLAAEFRAQGYEVFWEVRDHFEHMHVQWAANVTNQASRIADAQISRLPAIEAAATSAVATAVQAATPNTAPNEDIVVTGNRRAANDNFSTIGNTAISELANAPMPEIRVDDSLAAITRIRNAMQVFNIITEQTREQLAALGPQGEAVLALSSGMTSIGSSVTSAIQVFETGEFGSKAEEFASKFTAVASIAQAAISTIQGFMNASSQSRIENIDKEIAAEQRRDGKSAESLAKLQSMEKRKEAIAKKQFNINKKLMMAQAIIATATGIAQALSYGPLGIPLAVLIGALGAAQLAIIAGTSYQSTSAPPAAASGPSSLSIGKSGDSVDLAKQNSNPGGELGYLRGNKGVGSNSSNYRVIGSAYGSDNMLRGYGSSAFIVGEKGPEIISPESPISVTPVNDNESNNKPINATFNIQALDASGVEELLVKQKGNIISMIREAANSSGQRFLEDVRVDTYSRPNVGRI